MSELPPMLPGIEWYKQGWNDCLNLLKMMVTKSDYESWDQMIQELDNRWKAEPSSKDEDEVTR